MQGHASLIAAAAIAALQRLLARGAFAPSQEPHQLEARE